ncbi:LOW QUALITY PROTEIN: general transcription factor IIIA, b [Pholidichthys leucotaenia]
MFCGKIPRNPLEDSFALEYEPTGLPEFTAEHNTTPDSLLKVGGRLQSQKKKRSFICTFSDCKVTFSKLWKLEAHLDKHTGLQPFSCNCDKCFSCFYQFTRHELSHSGEKPHKCQADGCSEAFNTNASLKDHMAQVHQHQRKQYQCGHQGCGKDFSKKHQLKAHMREHQDVLPFCCFVGDCTKAFPSRGKLKRHKKMHEGYPCESEACPYVGHTWSEYVKHRKGHKVKVPYEKRKVFSNSWFVRQHELRVHSGEKRTFVRPRKGCNKMFPRSFLLESGIQGDHEGEKPFSCTYTGCGKSFAMKESLWRHGVVHDPAKRKLKKLHPKTHQAETSELSAKLLNTFLEDVS